MTSTRSIVLMAVAAVAVALVIGLVSVAGAGSRASLPEMSAGELLAKMAGGDDQPPALSGEVSWQNRLFGDLRIPSEFGHGPARSPLIGDGSGRMWASEAGTRLESQGNGGDRLLVVDKASRTAWTYDSATNSAVRYVMAGGGVGSEGPKTPLPSPDAADALTPAAISAYLQRLAAYATVDVTGQDTAAGHEAYILRMTPTADDTALGSVQAAIDGETMTPLRLQVFARGAAQPSLHFGFDTVSYAAVDDSLFAFSPPEGAEVKTEEIDSSGHGDRPDGDKPREGADARQALLTREQASELVDHDLAWARQYEARPFRWAYVFAEGGPLTAAGDPVFGMAGAGAPRMTGQTSVLLYGSGFGAIALAQTKTTPDLEAQLEQLPALTETTPDGRQIRSLTTPLGGLIVWQHGDTTLAAGGLVTKADLEAFVATVR